ncbi:glutamate--tRNA ligase [Blattabacterium cuenoti]|uniref:glutamate--tRNA ligase n=1 Tax=Blattabacterium cuenoti TaxID=1653831 RepID=UPI00163CAC05|nr:glutamate--tRNA ligase [Blattabacterium cuenoti]
MLKPIRVRFAPSPTGILHLGGVRTALYNYLFAKKNNGTFILRIEDTDKKRLNPISESYILETLNWCGINPDEGVGCGGPHYPYYQSKRNHIYEFYLNKLLKNGYAYYAFDTDENLFNKRKEYEKLGLTFSYNHNVRMNMDNSLSMTKNELNRRLKSNCSYVVRFKINPGIILKASDMIRGYMEINTNYLDDKILLKSDKSATYHLANTIDDHIMNITHVLRGDEWISSVFFHILIYNSFGWKPPYFAHLPLILRKDGKGKISKRNISSSSYPIFPIQWEDPINKKIIPGFRELGFFSESFINMIALLGWNPGDNKEILSLQELINYFSINNISKSGVFFDIKKAIWFNKQYIKNKKKDIFIFLVEELKKRSLFFEKKYIWKVIHLTINRICFIHEIWKYSYYFFVAPDSYDYSLFKYVNPKYGIHKLEYINNKLCMKNFSFDRLKSFFYKEKDKKVLLQLIRLSLVGRIKGVELFIIFKMLGKKECFIRIKKLIEKIKFL